MSKIIDGIVKDLKAIPETLKAKTAGVDKKKLILMNLPYILAGYFCDKIAWLWRVSPGSNACRVWKNAVKERVQSQSSEHH